MDRVGAVLSSTQGLHFDEALIKFWIVFNFCRVMNSINFTSFSRMALSLDNCCSPRVRRYSFWTLIALLTALTAHDVYVLVEEYLEVGSLRAFFLNL